MTPASAAHKPVTAARLTIVPANEASCDDLAAIFGGTDYPGRCQCQHFKIAERFWHDSAQGQRAAMLREQTGCGNPGARATSGLVAYLDAAPAGWGPHQ